MQVKTAIKRKVRKEPAGGSKKRKQLGNESPLASMFQKQHTAIDLSKAREAYNVLLQKVLGLDEAAHAEPCAPVRKQHTSHGRVGYSGCNSANTKCGPQLCAKAFRSGRCL
jgi:hypothetical protein